MRNYFNLDDQQMARPGPHLSRVLLLFVAVLAALILFGVLAEDVAEGDSIFFDQPVLFWLRGFSSEPLDQLMRAVTWLGSAAVIIPLLLLAAWRLQWQRWPVIYLATANLGVLLLNLAAKHGFERMRPAFWAPLVPVSSYSFPSGHAMQSMALACSLLVVAAGLRQKWAWRLLAAAYVVAVGTSRMYLGVHYPSDVLAGWCASFCWCAGLAYATRRMRMNHQNGSFSLRQRM
ncbi:phosphatase PAP2 family protein [Duganella sp. CY15W]|uniref:phosphatase PAP2 family protein n=1 Tax=Duganella sp. CY15W TaxID=2692172 RepID=UPI00136E48E3|nr:phosphatase PAP2 family protein [Duganella sp. CY15W]MYM27994.1 phosphatase PAP2 family protein [Duganella sp. CY15W]